MGQGGTFVLINGTPYNWVRTNQHSYQMNSWNFPSPILPGMYSSLRSLYNKYD